jgi:hypothetical protein
MKVVKGLIAHGPVNRVLATFCLSARGLCCTSFAALMVGCEGGYPQGDGAVLSPVTMSQGQRVAAMNAVGKLHYLEERWRYKLNDACELKISTGSRLSGNNSDWVSLERARVVKSFDRSDKTHDIFLQSTDTTVSRVESVPLVTGAKWADAVHLMSLAQFMQRDCMQRG